MLRVLAVHGHGGIDFFVDNHEDLYALLGFTLQDSIQAIVFVLRRWTAKVEFRREPPCALAAGP